MKKVLSVILALAMVISCVAMIQITSFASNTETALDVNFEDSSAAGYKWDGTVGKPNPTYENGAVKFTGVGTYSSPYWALGSKIKAFANSNPDSTITINVTAKIKADAEDSKFRMLFRNESDGTFLALNENPSVGTEWTTVQNTYTVSSDVAAEAADNGYRLCFDRMGSENVFYIDSLKVTFTAVGAPVAMQYEVTKSMTEQEAGSEMAVVVADMGFAQDLSYLASAKDADGKVTVSFKVYNPNDYAIKASAGVQVAWNYLTLDGVVVDDVIVINAKSYAVVSAVFDVDENGNATNKNGEPVTLDKASYRINVYNADESGFGATKNWGLATGTQVIVAPDANAKLEYIQAMDMWAGKKEVIDTLPNYPLSVDTPENPGDGGNNEETAPTPTPEVKVPTGFKVTYNTETKSDRYILTSKGIFTAADVKNGEITRTYTVKNTCDEDLTVKLEFQVLHTKDDGGKTWKGPESGTYVEVPAGESVEITYSCDVEDGKVTVDGTEYDISELFLRIDVCQSSVELPEGVSVTVYCGQKDAEAFVAANSRAFKDNSTVELVYGKVEGSGDVLPVAFIALTVVASVALAVVVKKKKEIF